MCGYEGTLLFYVSYYLKIIVKRIKIDPKVCLQEEGLIIRPAL